MNEENTGTGLEIAVIGMGGKFPGAEDVTQFWNNLKIGAESISFFSDEELEEAGVGPDLMDHPHYVRANGVLEGIEFFDASFFGYIPNEAEIMDPQVRVFHETVWCALEDAGYDPFTYEGMIGLYAGASPQFDWQALTKVSGKDIAVGPFTARHFAIKDFMYGRISHRLDLRGPSFSLYTACSTSLVALHLACQAILNGECDLALAGGVTVTILDHAGYVYEEGMVKSADGHCRTFDAASTGLVVGNAAGAVLLKRLEDAAVDGDYIYAVIKGSAINNDGSKKVGFTAPSVEGQVDAIRTARMMAEVEPESITYVETHGTGTALGDPVEVEALKIAFDTDKTHFCGIGSVKTNIGHTDSAAGIAGFIKTVLALNHKMMPPSLFFKTPNPKLGLEDSPFFVVDRPLEWKNETYPLRAGVSSFGIGGTNAHVILEEWNGPQDLASGGQGAFLKNRPLHPQKTFLEGHSSEIPSPGLARRCPEGRGGLGVPQLILLSAKTSAALERGSGKLAKYLKENPGIDLADAAYTLQAGRSHFNHRRMVVCGDTAEAAAALADPGIEKVRTNLVKAEKKPVVFMFSGQGSQYVNMGLELYRIEPLFREEIDACFDILPPIMGLDVKEILYPPAGKEKEAKEKIDDAVYTGPIKFIFEYAVAKLLMKWGVTPRAMIGHSFGEYVVACLAGVLPLEGALELVALRGKLMMKMPFGVMMSVPLPEEEIKPLLNEDLSLAAVNTPNLSIVSGTPGAVDTFEQEMKDRGQECLRINFPRASHSNMMKPIVAEFVDKVKQIKLGKPQIPYISGLSGRWITVSEAADPGYWGRHLVETVRFSGGIKELLNEPGYMFIQVGCDKGLPLFVSHHLDLKAENVVVNMVKHKKEKMSDYIYFLNQLGGLWLAGLPVNWREFHSREKRRRIPLPAYSFEKQEYMTRGNPFRMAVEMLSGVSPGRKGVNDLFYIPSWVRTRRPLIAEAAVEDTSACLMFLDEYGLGAKMADRLRKEGRQVYTVTAGAGFNKKGDREYTIDPGSEKDYDSLIDNLVENEKSIKQVFHLWHVDRPAYEELAIDRVDTVMERGLFCLIAFTKVLGARGLDEKMRIEIISSNMQDAAGEEFLYPEKATVTGAAKVIPLEFNNIDCRSIDIVLPPPGSEEEEKLIDRVLSETRQETFVQTVAFRGSERWEQILKPVRLEKPPDVPLLLKEGGVYLVTGGLGGIGLEMAKYLAGKVKAKLILSGRSALPEGKDRGKWLDAHAGEDKVSIKIRKVEELEKLGAEVLVVAADVTDRSQVQELLSRAKKRFGTLNGVIHTAGIPGGGSIQLKTREMLNAAVEAKVKGTVILDNLLKDCQLDFFILCSSGNSFVPVFGQVDYCAANAFLDAFANYNTIKHGRFTQSVNWDRWRSTGMAVAVEKKHKQNTDSEMAGGITAREGTAAFEITLHNPYPQIIVNDGDLNVDMELRKRRPKPAARRVTEEKETEASARVKLRPRPELSAEYVPPGNEIEGKLAELFQGFFGIEKVGVNDDFFELGGDSLKALTIIAHIKREVNPNITLSNLLLAPTIRELAAGSRVPGKFDKLECIVQLNEGDKERNIFMIHPRHGMVYQYKDLGKLLEEDFNLYGVQARGLLKKSKLPKNYSIAAADYVNQIREVQKEGPYIIAAFCIGDMIGYNMVKRLEDNDCIVEKFIMMDEFAFVPTAVLKYYRQEQRFEALLKPVKKLLHRFGKKSTNSREEEIEKLLAEIEQDGVKDKGAVHVSPEEAESLKNRVKQHFGRLIAEWERRSLFKRIDGVIKAPILHIRAKDSFMEIDEKVIKKMTFGKVTFETIPGGHDDMFESPQVEQLVQLIKKRLLPDQPAG